jgi:DNA-damage-inducible protein J
MANGKSNVNVRIDTDVEEIATQLLECMGLDQTTAIDMFYRQIIAERRLPFQPVASPTSLATLSLDEQIVAAALKRNPKRVSLPTDENGNVIIDKEKHPDIYDWAANG